MAKTKQDIAPLAPASRAVFLLMLLLACAFSLTLPGCGTVASVTGKVGVSSDKEARYVKPEDPMARPVQVAWTAARAKHCGFMFNPDQLKASYLADESRRGIDPNQLQKIAKAYDYTYTSLLETIAADPAYCNRERTDAIRVDLKRYLAGDFTPNAKAAR
jgi:hypothetical protein